MRVVMQFGPHVGQTVLVSPMVGRALLADGRACAVPSEAPPPAALRVGTTDTACVAVETRDPVVAPNGRPRRGRR